MVHQGFGNVFWQQFRQARHHRIGPPGAPRGLYRGLRDTLPIAGIAKIRPWVVTDQQGHGNIIICHRRPSLCHGRGVAPNIRVIIQRVGQGHHRPQGRAEILDLPRVKRWKNQPSALRSIGS